MTIMNLPIILHSLFTDIRKDKWLIALFFLSVFFTNNLVLVMIVGGVIAIRLAKERNLTRITVHWRIRPISGFDWAMEIALFITLIFLIPVFIKQGWIAHSSGLDPGGALRSCLEAVIWVLATLLGFFGISAISSSGQKFGVLATAVFAVGTGTNIFLGSSPRFLAGTPSGYDWMSSASHIPVVQWWWITWLGIILATVAILWLSRMGENHILLFGGTLAITLLLAISYRRSENIHYRIQIDDGPASVKLRALKKGEESKGQQIFREIEITGLPKGAWVDLLSAKVRNSNAGKKHEQKLSYQFGDIYGINGLFAENAYRQLVPKNYLSLVFYEVESNSFKETPGHPEKSIFSHFSEPGPIKVRTYGEIYQWEQFGEIPFEAGANFTKKGIKVELERIGGTSLSLGRKHFRLRFSRPYLKSSANNLENRYRSHRYRSFDYALITATREESEEAVMLGRVYGLDVESFRNPDSLFNLERIEYGHFQIKEDPRWRILWPEDEVTDTTAKWLSGAKLQIYTLNYLGRFDDTIELPAKE